MVLSLRVCFVVLLSISFTGASARALCGAILPTTPPTDSLSYLALGDSYTICESVAEQDRWPVQLQKRLNEAGVVAILPPEIIAQTGWTTADLKAGMDAAQVDGKTYDMVSLLIGVNNQFQGKSVDDYAVEFEALLARAIDLAGSDPNNVFVLSIPDYKFTPFGRESEKEISKSLAKFNEVCAEICFNYGVLHFDITPISQSHVSGDKLVATDGLHPSGAQYTLWVEQIWKDVQLHILGN